MVGRFDSRGAFDQGDHSGGIVATANFSYDPAAQEPTYDVDASSVSVTSQGDITTAGYEAMGIAAAASKGDVSVVSDGDIATAGEGAMGILASGQNVTVKSTSAIATEGDGAFGIAVVDIQMVNGDAEITGNGVSGDISVTGDIMIAAGVYRERRRRHGRLCVQLGRRRQGHDGQVATSGRDGRQLLHVGGRSADFGQRNRHSQRR